MPEDRSWVAFTLRPEARFHDGKPITADDVICSFETLKTKGHPLLPRLLRQRGEGREGAGERQVKFTFEPRRQPRAAADHGPAARSCRSTTGKGASSTRPRWSRRSAAAPTGSSASSRAARSPTSGSPTIGARICRSNAAATISTRVRYDYYRDPTSRSKPSRPARCDLRPENTAKLWATGLRRPGVQERADPSCSTVDHEIPTGMQGFVFNLRRPIFQDPRVRQALALRLRLRVDATRRCSTASTRAPTSYFSNSELASRGLPEGEELALLEPFRDQLRRGGLHHGLRAARDRRLGQHPREPAQGRAAAEGGRLDRAGRQASSTRRASRFEFEILLASPDFERIAQPFVQNLERLGIAARIRTVDPAQYQNRMDDFDFDMTVEMFGQSLSPGNEQRDFWGSAAADIPGSRNTLGIKDPVVDELVEARHRGADAREPRRAHARARPRAAVGPLRDPALAQPRLPRRLLGQVRPSGGVRRNTASTFDAWWVDPARSRPRSAGAAR